MGHLYLALFTLFSVAFFSCIKCYEEKHFNVPFQRKIIYSMLLKHHNHILRDTLIQTLLRNEHVRTNHFPIIRDHNDCYTCIPLFTLVFIVLKRPVFPVVQTLARLSTLQITIPRKSTSRVLN